MNKNIIDLNMKILVFLQLFFIWHNIKNHDITNLNVENKSENIIITLF